MKQVLDVVHVIGASGRSGAALCRALTTRGTRVVPIIRNGARYAAAFPDASVGSGFEAPRIADLTGPVSALISVLADATVIVCTAHARNIPALVAAAPKAARLICLGSTRKFTRWPDAHGNGVLKGERALFASGRDSVILHPTMIYGAQGEDNVQRLAALLSRLPVVPLPAGGRALVQPIHQDDVTASLLAAIDRQWVGPHAVVIAGPVAVAYRDFVALVARAAGIPSRFVLALPGSVLMAAAVATAWLPKCPSVGPDEIRRLLEDKNFDIWPMIDQLSVVPRSLETGLGQLFLGR
nr:NADH-ubiquinone oxidoreductase [Acetobacter estunensis]